MTGQTTADTRASDAPGAGDEIDLIELLRSLWDSRYTIIGFTLVFACLGVTYALLATPWYKAEITLAPKQQEIPGGISAQLGGLASLAGLGGMGDDKSVEAIATIGSRELARAFIEAHDLVPRIFHAQWDAAAGRWKEDDPEKWPDVRDAIKFYQEEMVAVSQDRKTQLITLSVTWTDPDEAAAWASELVERVNNQMRTRAAREAEANLKYLNKELAATNVVNLQQSISRLIETEMQKLMVARNSEDYAVRTIDAAQIPKRPDRPKKPIVAVLATIAGGLLSLVWLGLRHVYRQFRLQGA
jgi:uncharacterized protein involved in exopolysaccharide biosynthesis